MCREVSGRALKLGGLFFLSFPGGIRFFLFPLLPVGLSSLASGGRDGVVFSLRVFVSFARWVTGHEHEKRVEKEEGLVFQFGPWTQQLVSRGRGLSETERE